MYAAPAGKQIFRMIVFLNVRICEDFLVFVGRAYRPDAPYMNHISFEIEHINRFSDFCKIANFWIVLLREFRNDYCRWQSGESGNKNQFEYAYRENSGISAEFENNGICNDSIFAVVLRICASISQLCALLLRSSWAVYIPLQKIYRKLWLYSAARNVIGLEVVHPLKAHVWR